MGARNKSGHDEGGAASHDRVGGMAGALLAPAGRTPVTGPA